MALSLRAQDLSKPNDKFLLWEVLRDLWHPEDNPNGYVSLGVAENTLMHGTLTRHINNNFNVTTRALTYGDGMVGSNRLRVAMSHFLTRYLRPHIAIEPAHITITNGCSASTEHLAWALSNPGDGILLGRPYFRAFNGFAELRPAAKIIPVSFGDVDPFGVNAVALYEQELLKCRDAGQKISSILICNPHNPTGKCYTREALIGLMKICQKYSLHLIADEIYALSTWNVKDGESNNTFFQSVLSIDASGIIDVARVHVIWGMSKDMGANGLRLGAIISQNNSPLHAALVPLAIHSSSSSFADHISANILEDSQWLDSYLVENSDHLAETYSYVTSWAQKHGIEYATGINSAFFLWANLGKEYQKRHPGMSLWEAEAALNQVLLKARVFLGTGESFAAEEGGWFRVTFTYSRNILDEGLRRVISVLDN